MHIKAGVGAFRVTVVAATNAGVKAIVVRRVTAKKIHETLKLKRKSSKRKQQAIESSPFKTSRIFYERRTRFQIEEPFNRLEFVILMVIYVALKGMKQDKKQ